MLYPFLTCIKTVNAVKDDKILKLIPTPPNPYSAVYEAILFLIKCITWTICKFRKQGLVYMKK